MTTVDLFTGKRQQMLLPESPIITEENDDRGGKEGTELDPFMVPNSETSGENEANSDEKE